MKITRVEALPFRIPMKKATAWARGVQDAAEHVLVKVHTDEGITGIVEAPPRPTIYGESVQSIKFAVEKWFGPMMEGLDPFELEKIWDKFNTIPWNPVAKGALDMAVYDIIGKALNMPCYKLLGYWTDAISMSWCVNLNPLNKMLDEAHEMISAYGFKALKLKVGIEPKKDIELVRTMRQEFGDATLLYVDANQGYDPFTAIRVLNEMAEYGIAMVEEPCPADDKKGRKMISQRDKHPGHGRRELPDARRCRTRGGARHAARDKHQDCENRFHALPQDSPHVRAGRDTKYTRNAGRLRHRKLCQRSVLRCIQEREPLLSE
jgi:L-Ala-D/L-Glu epimerase